MPTLSTLPEVPLGYRLPKLSLGSRESGAPQLLSPAGLGAAFSAWRGHRELPRDTTDTGHPGCVAPPSRDLRWPGWRSAEQLWGCPGPRTGPTVRRRGPRLHEWHFHRKFQRHGPKPRLLRLSNPRAHGRGSEGKPWRPPWAHMGLGPVRARAGRLAQSGPERVPRPLAHPGCVLLRAPRQRPRNVHALPMNSA